MSDKKDALLAFIVGGVIGAAIGILYAPKSGKETRKDIKKLGDEFADTVGDLSDEVKETGRKIYEEGREKVLSKRDKISEALEAGKKAFEKYAKED
ncbi:YtxH domain-containing protein [Endomicrobium proavitum]|uniref:Gas vesicle protein n=1 Tax=Endomicrobium proavitum TaxID=1408281 RepID=A0A0G3WI55_9BACT|nr:YtxH domain-containing protein [Endomicrobium proavitum]AKL97565.1 hypothetical protein Epro_0186 [Endomicrobium proavitum]